MRHEHSGRDTGRRRFVALVGCVLLGAAIGGWHNRLATRGRSDPVTSSVRTVTSPLVVTGSSATGWFAREFGWMVRGRRLDAENRRLRAENAELMTQLAQLREADITAQRLRAQLGFGAASTLDRVAADVISYRPNANFDTIVIDAGSRRGVELHDVVTAPAGLVGQVYSVTATTADVLLLTDSSSSVGAMVQRPQSRAIGVCKGSGARELSMAYVDTSADVRAGDVIVSSGLGGSQGIYPKGLPIGTVATVGVDAAGSTKRISVRPVVALDRLEEVYVLTSHEAAVPVKSVPPVQPKPHPR